jgi:hypothetical protein
MKQRIWIYLIGLFTVISTTQIACKKNDAQEQAKTSTLQPEIAAKVSSWLDQQKTASTSDQSTKIESLKKNLDLTTAFMELYRQTDQLVVIPIGNGFHSVNNKDKSPTNYLVMVLTKEGNITKGNVIQYVSAAGQKRVPQNTFSKIYNYQDLNCDGQFTILTITDDFHHELKFENGKLKSVAEQKRKLNPTNGRVTGCIAWYLVTTYYYSDGSTETTEDYLYTTCDNYDCQTTRIADGRSFRINCGGGGGDPSIDYEYESVATKVWYVYKQPSWDIFSQERLKGKKYTNTTGGYFTGITHVNSGSDYSGVTWSEASNEVSYNTESATSRTSGYYAESGGFGVYVNNSTSWKFSDVF